MTHCLSRLSGGRYTGTVALLFENDWLLLAGWIHYLAFDLFVGSWEVRDAHFLGLHGLQIIPLIGYQLSRTELAIAAQGASLAAATILYAGVGYAIFRQAIQGAPLVRM